MDDDGVYCHLDAIDDFEMAVALFHHHCTSDDNTWPWRGTLIPSRA
jgi:hypothetical protein